VIACERAVTARTNPCTASDPTNERNAMHTLLQAELAGVLARERAQAPQARPTTVAPRRLGFLSSRKRWLRARRRILLRGT
jgi:hypothetical protein